MTGKRLLQLWADTVLLVAGVLALAAGDRKDIAFCAMSFFKYAIYFFGNIQYNGFVSLVKGE